MKTAEKIKKLAEVSRKIGEIGVLIIENKKSAKSLISEAETRLGDLGYRKVKDYLELMDCLEEKVPCHYSENNAKLDNRIWEIIREYQGGIISFMDIRGHNGLKTVKYLPKDSPVIIILTRERIENGPDNFFEYSGPIESL